MSSVYEELCSWGVGNLKDFLSARGISCQGNKQQLVSRSYVAWENKVQLREVEKERVLQLEREYMKRLEEAGTTDPRNFPDDAWSKDVTKWPEVDLGKIFAFVLSTKEHGMEFVGQYKTHKAYSYYMSGFVDTIYCSKVNSTCVMKSKVTPSMSVRNEPHDVWIAMDMNGAIKTCWCSCIAGYASTCNHVIAVLYKVEYANTMGYTKPSCTTLPCAWNTSSKKDVQPAKVSQLNIRKDNRSKVSGAVTEQTGTLQRLTFDPRREDQRVVTSERVESLYSGLYKIDKESVLFKGLPINLPSRSTNMHIPLPLPDLAKKDPDNFMDIMNEGYTSQQVTMIESKTRQQAGSDTWREQRKGRLTASMHHEIITKMNTLVKKKDVVVSKLVARIMGLTSDLRHIPAVKYGADSEDSARKEFCKVHQTEHVGFKVEKCGLFVKPDRPYLAGSPDGIVTCQCHGKALLEIKCPYNIKDGVVQEEWGKTDFLEKKAGCINIKKTHKYFTQMQSQMGVTGIHRTYFFVWTPNSPQFTEVIDFEQPTWLENQQKLSQFFSGLLAPFLVGTKELHICPTCELVCLQQEEIKHQTDSSVMCDCCHLWYHFMCVGLASPPKEESWLCSTCTTSAEDL